AHRARRPDPAGARRALDSRRQRIRAPDHELQGLAMTAIYVSLALGLVAALGVMATVWSLLPAGPTNADTVEHRLRIYETGVPITTTESELQEPFTQRVVWPLIKRMGQLLEHTMPDKVRQQIHLKVHLAGRPGGLGTADFITLRYVLAALLLALGIGVGLLAGNRIVTALSACVGAVVGLYGPMVWLNWQVSRRRNEIQLDLPDVIDVLCVCVEAGLTLEAAMEQVVDKYDHALADELARVLQEVRLGRPRLEALADMGSRNGVEELNNFVQAVIQSEQLCARVSRILPT